MKKAVDLFNESLVMRRDIGDRGGCAWCLEKLAEIAIMNGKGESSLDSRVNYQRAASLFGAADAMREPVDSQIDLVDQPEYDRKIAFLREQLGEKDFTQAWHEGRDMTRDKSIEYALRYSSGSKRAASS